MFAPGENKENAAMQAACSADELRAQFTAMREEVELERAMRQQVEWKLAEEVEKRRILEQTAKARLIKEISAREELQQQVRSREDDLRKQFVKDEEEEEVEVAVAQEGSNVEALRSRLQRKQSEVSTLLTALASRDHVLGESRGTMEDYKEALRKQDALLVKSARLLAAERRKVADLQAALEEHTQTNTQANTLASEEALLDSHEEVLVLRCAMCSRMIPLVDVDSHNLQCEEERKKNKERAQKLVVNVCDPTFNENDTISTVKLVTQSDIPEYIQSAAQAHGNSAQSHTVLRCVEDFSHLFLILTMRFSGTIVPPFVHVAASSGAHACFAGSPNRTKVDAGRPSEQAALIDSIDSVGLRPSPSASPSKAAEPTTPARANFHTSSTAQTVPSDELLLHMQVFLTRLCSHRVMRRDECVVCFLTGREESWLTLRERYRHTYSHWNTHWHSHTKDDEHGSPAERRGSRDMVKEDVAGEQNRVKMCCPICVRVCMCVTESVGETQLLDHSLLHVRRSLREFADSLSTILALLKIDIERANEAEKNFTAYRTVFQDISDKEPSKTPVAETSLTLSSIHHSLHFAAHEEHGALCGVYAGCESLLEYTHAALRVINHVEGAAMKIAGQGEGQLEGDTRDKIQAAREGDSAKLREMTEHIWEEVALYEQNKSSEFRSLMHEHVSFKAQQSQLVLNKWASALSAVSQAPRLHQSFSY